MTNGVMLSLSKYDHLTQNTMLSKFSVAIAAGSHLFTFRTQQLSPSSAMVLHLRGCGRVASRRVKYMAPFTFVEGAFLRAVDIY